MSEDINYSDRGFAQFGEEIMTSYGDTVRIYESSAAAGPHIWLKLKGMAHLRGPSEFLAGVEHGMAPGDIAAHMTLEQAVQIRDRLTKAIEFSKERRV